MRVALQGFHILGPVQGNARGNGDAFVGIVDGGGQKRIEPQPAQ